MTLDKTPLTQQKQDPRAMVNFDTPKFDLGSVYGKGPTGSPELYDPNKKGYLLVNPHDELFDLPRDGVGAAYLGDPRNDENLIVAQLHVVFLRMHNKLMDSGKTFEQAQQQLRWTYQYLIVNDFLPRIVGQDVVNSLIRRRGTGPIQFTGKLYQPRNVNKPYMPVEYSGAAYRFGHSMIRAEYEVQDGHTVPIFGQDGYEDLRGNRPIPASLWIDWNYFFEIPGMNTPDDRNMARLIDTQLSLPLFTLPSTVVAPTADAIVALAERNLLRGKRLGLPAGQDVAAAMGLKPLTNAQLGLTDAGWNRTRRRCGTTSSRRRSCSAARPLGPVGGRIVAEVILGLLGWTRPRTSTPTRLQPRQPTSRWATSSSRPTRSTAGPHGHARGPEDPNAPRGARGPRSCRRKKSPEDGAPRGRGGAGGRGGGRGPGPAGACRAGQPGGHLTGRVRIPDRAGLDRGARTHLRGLAHRVAPCVPGLLPLHERGDGCTSAGGGRPGFGKADPRIWGVALQPQLRNLVSETPFRVGHNRERDVRTAPRRPGTRRRRAAPGGGSMARSNVRCPQDGRDTRRRLTRLPGRTRSAPVSGSRGSDRGRGAPLRRLRAFGRRPRPVGRRPGS